MEIDEKIFGEKIDIELENFVRVKHKNPYILGIIKDRDKEFTVYIGKNGLKIFPFSHENFIKLIFAIRGDEEVTGVFTDGNHEGFSVVLVEKGKIKKIFLCKRKGTSNKNETRAILFAVKKFPQYRIFSDSLIAIKRVSRFIGRERVVKVRAHSGVLWNAIADTILKYINEICQDKNCVEI
jgi:hypothetical protein